MVDSKKCCDDSSEHILPSLTARAAVRILRLFFTMTVDVHRALAWQNLMSYADTYTWHAMSRRAQPYLNHRTNGFRPKSLTRVLIALARLHQRIYLHLHLVIKDCLHTQKPRYITGRSNYIYS